MDQTQSFNTPVGIKKVRVDFHNFRQAMQAGHQQDAAQNLNRAYQATFLFPPCNVVNSLRNDFINYRFQNIDNDLQVIENDRDKIKY